VLQLQISPQLEESPVLSSEAALTGVAPVSLLTCTYVVTADQSTAGGEPSVEQRSSTDRCSCSEFAELHLCCDCRSVHSWRRAQC